MTIIDKLAEPNLCKRLDMIATAPDDARSQRRKWQEASVADRAESQKLRAFEDECARLTAIVAGQDDEIEELRAALKPFAEIPLWRDVYPDAKHDELTAQQVRGYIQVEHVRAARVAFKLEQKGNES
jgi:hypothetical protein